jgi:CO dehydrogenase maturation factor
MKVGVVGKGGVGKTTLAALLAQEFRARGRRVLAIDTDSNPNLAVTLGLNLDEADEVPLLPRRLAVGGGDGAMTTAELVEQYGVMTPAQVMLIHAMRITQAGAG